MSATRRPGSVAARPGAPAPARLNDALWTHLSAAGARLGRWPWWAQVAGVYILARLVSAGIFMAAALHQGANPWYPDRPDYWNFIYIWDARWYGTAVQSGYPAELPLDDNGRVAENAWAFYPLFPMLGRVLSVLTGTGTAWALTALAMACGLGASLVVYSLFRLRADHQSALWGLVFFASFPVSAVLQVPYAESLNLLLLGLALLLVLQRRYLWATPVVLLMCLSRPTGVPFALMAGLLLAYRLWQRHADGKFLASGPPRLARAGRAPALAAQDAPHTRGQLGALAGLTAASGLSALLWPAVAWAVTGDLAAYTKTETAWRGHDLVPFKPWFDTGIMLFGPVVGVLAPFVLVAGFALLMMSRPVAALGVELRLWCGCYMAYLLVFLHPQTSTFRLLLPLFPLALGAALISRSRAYRGAVVVMFLLLQIVWIVWLWAWAPLPGGGDYPP